MWDFTSRARQHVVSMELQLFVQSHMVGEEMDKKDKPAEAGEQYDEEVLNAGWMPQPEAVAPQPGAHQPVSSPAAEEDADAFLESVYRSQR